MGRVCASSLCGVHRPTLRKRCQTVDKLWAARMQPKACLAYGPRHIPISGAQYKANGYKPALEKLMIAKSLTAQKSRARPPVERRVAQT